MANIVWDRDERDRLIDRAADILSSDPHVSVKKAVRRAMEEVLPEYRWRKLDKLREGSFDWLLEALGVERRPSRVHWTHEERRAVVREARRLRGSGPGRRDIELLKDAMRSALPRDRLRYPTNLNDGRWDWFREGVHGADPDAHAPGERPARVRDIRPPEGRPKRSSGDDSRSRTIPAVGDDPLLTVLIRAVADLQDRIGRLEKGKRD